MRSFIAVLAILALTLTVSPSLVLAAGPAHDHTASGALGEAASQEGAAFVEGAKKIAKPFIVVGKTVVDGTQFVIFKTAQGVVWIAEEAVVGLKYVAKGAKFVIVKTAEGVRWVAVQAIKAGEIIFDAVVDLATLVIEDVVYVLVKLEEGVVFVAKKAVEAGKVVVNGIEYVAHKTIDGVVWVSRKTWDGIKAGASWTRNKIIATNIRQRLAGALAIGQVGDSTMSYFEKISINSGASASTRRLARASLAACKAFNAEYNN